VSPNSAQPFRVALTFDAEHPDRPTEPGVTARIEDALADAGAVATFFVQGRWAEAEPRVARRIADEGHLVGNHSHHHARLTMLTTAAIRRDALAAERAIRDATGVSPAPWYRCPFGAGAGSRRVLAALAAVGYVDVGWTVDSQDWTGVAAPRLAAAVVQGTVAAGDGTVVLMHGWPVATAIALPEIIARLRDAGAELVRIDALPDVPGRRLPGMGSEVAGSDAAGSGAAGSEVADATLAGSPAGSTVAGSGAA
jgi:peptidoglycan-N-acetylglucosamine deacetylase